MFSKKRKNTDSEVVKESDSPSQDYSMRFALDQLLRKHGFAIAARPANSSAIWERNGKRYSQAEAAKTLDRNAVLNAESDADYAAFLAANGLE